MLDTTLNSLLNTIVHGPLEAQFRRFTIEELETLVGTDNWRLASSEAVRKIYQEMADNRWSEPAGCVIKVSRGGDLIDGQHRLLAELDWLLADQEPHTWLVITGCQEADAAKIDVGRPRNMKQWLARHQVPRATSLLVAINSGCYLTDGGKWRCSMFVSAHAMRRSLATAIAWFQSQSHGSRLSALAEVITPMARKCQIRQAFLVAWCWSLQALGVSQHKIVEFVEAIRDAAVEESAAKTGAAACARWFAKEEAFRLAKRLKQMPHDRAAYVLKQCWNKHMRGEVFRQVRIEVRDGRLPEIEPFIDGLTEVR